MYIRHLTLTVLLTVCFNDSGWAASERSLFELFGAPLALDARDGPHVDRALSLISEVRNLEAVPFLRSALEVQKSVPEAELQVACTSYVLATLLIEVDQVDEAESHLRVSLEIAHRKLGKRHAATAMVLKGLGDVYRSRGEFVEAESAYSQAITILEHTRGDPRAIPVAMTGFATSLLARGEDRKALRMLQRCAESLDRLGDSAALQKAYVNELIGAIENRRGKFDRALALLMEAFPEVERHLGPDHLGVGSLAMRIGLIHLRHRSAMDAEPMLARALRIYDRALGADHPASIELRRHYAEVLRKLERWKKQHASAASAGR